MMKRREIAERAGVSHHFFHFPKKTTTLTVSVADTSHEGYSINVESSREFGYSKPRQVRGSAYYSWSSIGGVSSIPVEEVRCFTTFDIPFVVSALLLVIDRVIGAAGG